MTLSMHNFNSGLSGEDQNHFDSHVASSNILAPGSSGIHNEVGMHSQKASAINGSDLPKHSNHIARTADKAIEAVIYTFLALSGLYVCFSGFKTFRLTMVILGFYVSYFCILFPLVVTRHFQGDNLGHQIGLFFLSLTLGFILSVLCYVLDKVNFLIFGTAVSCMLGLFLAEFLLDIRVKEDWYVFLIVFVAAVFVCSTVAFFVLDHFIIWGFAFVGAVIVPISLGILFKQIIPFENWEITDGPATDKFMAFLAISVATWMAGMACQYWLRRRLIRKWQDDGEEVNPRATFLEDRF